MQMISETITVNTGAPTEILRFFSEDLLNCSMKAVGELRIGTAAVTGSKGYPLAAGTSRSYNRDDFVGAPPGEPVVFYAATLVNTTIDVTGFFNR